MIDILVLLAATPAILAVGISLDLLLNGGSGLRNIIRAYKGYVPIMELITDLQEEISSLYDDLTRYIDEDDEDDIAERTSINAQIELKKDLLATLLTKLV